MAARDTLTGEQQERVFGTARMDDAVYPFFCVSLEGNWAPDSLCYLACADGSELGALRDYTRRDEPGWIWVRVIDDDIRGWSEDEVLAMMWGGEPDGPVFVLAAPQ